MKYMADASLAHIAPKLRDRGSDCDAVQLLMRKNEDSQEHISDGEIASIPKKDKGAIKMIDSGITFEKVALSL